MKISRSGEGVPPKVAVCCVGRDQAFFLGGGWAESPGFLGMKPMEPTGPLGKAGRKAPSFPGLWARRFREVFLGDFLSRGIFSCAFLLPHYGGAFSGGTDSLWDGFIGGMKRHLGFSRGFGDGVRYI